MSILLCSNLLRSVVKYALCMKDTNELVDKNNQLQMEIRCEQTKNITENIIIQVSCIGPWTRKFHVRNFLYKMFSNKGNICIDSQSEQSNLSVDVQQKGLETNKEIKYTASFDNDGKWIVVFNEANHYLLKFDEYFTVTVKTNTLPAEKNMLADTMYYYIKKFCIFRDDIIVSFNCGSKAYNRDSVLTKHENLTTKLRSFFVSCGYELVNINLQINECPIEDLVMPFECARKFQGLTLKIISFSLLLPTTCFQHLHVVFFGPGFLPLDVDETIWHSSISLRCKGFSFVSNLTCGVSNDVLMPDVCYHMKSNKVKVDNASYFVLAMFDISFKNEFLFDVLANVQANFPAIFKKNKPRIQKAMKKALENVLCTNSASCLKTGISDERLEEVLSSSIAHIIRHSFNDTFRKQCFDLLGATNTVDAERNFHSKLVEIRSRNFKMLSSSPPEAAGKSDESQPDSFPSTSDTFSWLQDDNHQSLSFEDFQERPSQGCSSSDTARKAHQQTDLSSTTLPPNVLFSASNRPIEVQEERAIPLSENSSQVIGNDLDDEILAEGTHFDCWFDDEFRQLSEPESLLCTQSIETEKENKWIDKALAEIDSWE